MGRAENDRGNNEIEGLYVGWVPKLPKNPIAEALRKARRVKLEENPKR